CQTVDNCNGDEAPGIDSCRDAITRRRRQSFLADKRGCSHAQLLLIGGIPSRNPGRPRGANTVMPSPVGISGSRWNIGKTVSELDAGNRRQDRITRKALRRNVVKWSAIIVSVLGNMTLNDIGGWAFVQSRLVASAVGGQVKANVDSILNFLRQITG